jgi:hypothetical protein
MADSQSTFLELAISSKVVRSAVKVSIIVGTILALINHGGSIFRLALSTENLFQIALTYLVPYCVSTYSSVRAIQAHPRETEP